jgi:methionine synthase II (cobalamin-independent)
MFATVLGRLPRPAVASGVEQTDDEAVQAAIAAQKAAGIEPVTDGGLRRRDWLAPLEGLDGIRRRSDGALEATLAPTWTHDLTVPEWRAASGASSMVVKQALPGPYTAARRVASDVDRERLTLALAEALNTEIRALAGLGCQMIEIEEPGVVEIGSDNDERRLFVDAHRRLTSDVSGVHLSLAVTGGNADAAGAETILAAPYSSYAFDLINGPDNWRLVTRVPGDRGIICGVLDARQGSDDSVELLVWAAHYAASTNGRGIDRVGLAVTPGLELQDWATALTKLSRLGRAAQVAGLRGDELAASIDPRAVDIRSAALGRHDPRARRARRRP